MPSWLRQILRAPEGEGAPGGTPAAAGGGSMFQAPPAGEAPPGGGDGAPPAGEQPAGGDAGKQPDPNRPVWLPEKYATPEELAKGYTELSRKFSTKNDALKAELRPEVEQSIRQEMGVPEKPEGYAYPSGFEAPGEALDGALRKWAHENGVSAKAFEALINDVQGQRVADAQAEVAKLGTNAEARLSSINGWLHKNVAADHFPVVERIMTTAEGVAFLEAMRDGKKSTGFAPKDPTPQPPSPALTRAEIRDKQADPRFGQDPAYTAEVRALWARYAALPEDQRK